MDDDIEEEEIEPPTLNHHLPDKFNAKYLLAMGNNASSAQQVMGTYVHVVHTNRIHNVAMISCKCCGQDVLPCDLLAVHLLPASFELIRTLFLAQLLDHYHLCNLELKAMAYQFYHLLVTSILEVVPSYSKHLRCTLTISLYYLIVLQYPTNYLYVVFPFG